MEMEFANDVKWAMLPTVKRRSPSTTSASLKGNKSQMSYIDVNDASIMALGIQPRRQ